MQYKIPSISAYIFKQNFQNVKISKLLLHDKKIKY